MIEVLEEVSAGVKQLSAVFDNPERILRNYGEWWLGKIDDEFVSESDPYGRAWPSLTEATLRSKQRKRQPTAKLQAYRFMRNATAYSVEGNQLMVGFNDKKAEFHDKGTSRMPKRQLFPDEQRGLPNDAVEELKDLLTEALLKI